MWMTSKRRGARAKFWFSMKTSMTCLGRPLPSRLVVSRFTNVPQLKFLLSVTQKDKRTVGKKADRKGEGEMRKGLLKGISPASAKAMRFGNERQRLC
jgi:hypothetical protein